MAPAVVPIEILYPVASVLAVQVNVGVTETPVAAAAGKVTEGQNVFVVKFLSVHPVDAPVPL